LGDALRATQKLDRRLQRERQGKNREAKIEQILEEAFVTPALHSELGNFGSYVVELQGKPTKPALEKMQEMNIPFTLSVLTDPQTAKKRYFLVREIDSARPAFYGQTTRRGVDTRYAVHLPRRNGMKLSFGIAPTSEEVKGLKEGEGGYIGSRVGQTRYEVVAKNDGRVKKLKRIPLKVVDEPDTEEFKKALQGQPFTVVAVEGVREILIEFRPAAWFEKAPAREIAEFMSFVSPKEPKKKTTPAGSTKMAEARAQIRVSERPRVNGVDVESYLALDAMLKRSEMALTQAQFTEEDIIRLHQLFYDAFPEPAQRIELVALAEIVLDPKMREEVASVNLSRGKPEIRLNPWHLAESLGRSEADAIARLRTEMVHELTHVRWDSRLKELFPGKPLVRDTVHEVLAYLATVEAMEQAEKEFAEEGVDYSVAKLKIRLLLEMATGEEFGAIKDLAQKEEFEAIALFVEKVQEGVGPLGLKLHPAQAYLINEPANLNDAFQIVFAGSAAEEKAAQAKWAGLIQAYLPEVNRFVKFAETPEQVARLAPFLEEFAGHVAVVAGEKDVANTPVMKSVGSVTEGEEGTGLLAGEPTKFQVEVILVSAMVGAEAIKKNLAQFDAARLATAGASGQGASFGMIPIAEAAQVVNRHLVEVIAGRSA
jgi:hypothetical protein